MSIVSHPAHYNSGKFEVIEVIEDQFLGFHLGNVVKYVCRAGRKDKNKLIEDLEKAEWYLKRKIELLKAQKENREPLRPNDMTRKPPTPTSTSPFLFRCELCRFFHDCTRLSDAAGEPCAQFAPKGKV